MAPYWKGILVVFGLTLLTAADRILVLADGHIVEQGSHTELIHADSDYARLVRKQAHGLRLPRAMRACSNRPRASAPRRVGTACHWCLDIFHSVGGAHPTVGRFECDNERVRVRYAWSRRVGTAHHRVHESLAGIDRQRSFLYALPHRASHSLNLF